MSTNMSEAAMQCLAQQDYVGDFPANKLLSMKRRPRRASIERKGAFTKTTIAQILNDNSAFKNLKNKIIAADIAKAGEKDDAMPFNGEYVNEMHASSQDRNRFKGQTVTAFNTFVTPQVRKFPTMGGLEDMQKATERIHIIARDIMLVRTDDSEIIGEDSISRSISQPTVAIEPSGNWSFMKAESYFHRDAHERVEEGPDLDISILDTELQQLTSSIPELIVGNRLDQNVFDNRKALVDLEAPPSKAALHACISVLPGLYHLRHYSVEGWNREIPTKETLNFVLWKMRQANACGLRREKWPFADEKDEVKVLRQFLFCAPKLQHLLDDIWDGITTSQKQTAVRNSNDNTPKPKRNVVIYVQHHTVGHLVRKLLRFMCIENLLLHIKMTAEYQTQLLRDQFLNSFRPSVLILPYALKMSGIDLAKYCAMVVFLEKPPDLRTFKKAVGGVYHAGQDAPDICKHYWMESE